MVSPFDCCQWSLLVKHFYPNTGKMEFFHVPETCRDIYCKKCYEAKYSRHHKRLNSYAKLIKVRRLVHFSCGLKVSVIEDILPARRELQKMLRKFILSCRKRYLFRGFRVFDLAKSKDGYFVHFHFALLPESNQFDNSFLNSAISKASKGDIKVFVRHKYASKKALFDYFSKRMSGYFGHKKLGTNFFLEDVMTLEQSDIIFKNMRKLQLIFPRGIFPSKAGLTCIMGNFAHPEDHPDYHTVQIVGIKFRYNSKKPPPDTWRSEKDMMRWVLKHDFVSFNRDGRELISEYSQLGDRLWRNDKHFMSGDQTDVLSRQWFSPPPIPDYHHL